MSAETRVDLKHGESGDFVTASFAFPEGTTLKAVSEIFRATAGKMEADADTIIDVDDLPDLAEIRLRNIALDELQEKWPGVAFMRPLKNGEL